MILIPVKRNNKAKFNFYKEINQIKINTLIKQMFLPAKIIQIIVYKLIKMIKIIKTFSNWSLIKMIFMKLRKQS